MLFLPKRTQWSKWTLVSKAGYLGAWFGGLGLLLAIMIVLLQSVPENKIDKELSKFDDEFSQLMFRVNEEIMRPFDDWIEATQDSLWCEKGSRIGTLALVLADQIIAIDGNKLRLIRLTKLMAKHEYLMMLYSFAAAVADTCPYSTVALNPGMSILAHVALTYRDSIVKLRDEILTADNTDPNYADLCKKARDIDNITYWYAARVRCILCLRYKDDCHVAYEFAQRAHDLYPDERIRDPWIDRVRQLELSSSISEEII